MSNKFYKKLNVVSMMLLCIGTVVMGDVVKDAFTVLDGFYDRDTGFYKIY